MRPFILLQALLQVLLAVFTRATPSGQEYQFIEKRPPPPIKIGYNVRQKSQLSGGSSDAQTIARYVQTTAARTLDSILSNNFRPQHKTTVLEVFKKITSDDVSVGTGSATLGRITISQDYQDENGDWACDEIRVAEMRLYDTARQD